ncbi:glutamate receptor ionotropic, kainate 2-like [Penaeus monodon]|uniref:glutamate receptor ionotropic, kainate 2-like n=1 Tax=Penaeus monodon TaxID=6687 RepID=UPI0018A78ECE|nr:glutamate receptor ionotropic, kainate 2-like [Penaeus monodon]XP_037803444.1 glutamate receptor ionotropic, kainate 2-like [Penaeus monodon]
MNASPNETTSCLKIGIEQWAPYVSFIYGEAPNYQVTGTSVEIIDMISRHLNTCYEFVVAKDRVFGTQLPNGSWTGLMGLITRREVDMTAVVLSVDYLRDRAVDFSVPLYVDQQAVGYKRPVFEADMLGFVKPYTDELWFLLLTTVVLVFGCTFMIQHLQIRRTSSGKPGDDTEMTEKETVKSMWAVSLWILGALLAQSVPSECKGNSVRFIRGLWLLSALIIGSIYRSNLKAMLILPRLRLPFDSLEELVETDIPTYVYEDSMIHQAIMTAAPGTSLYKLRKQALVRRDVLTMVNEVSEGAYAVFFGKKAFESIIHHIYGTQGTCPLYMAKGTVFTTSLCLAFPKGSPLVKKVNPLLYRMKESGILNHMYLHGLSNYTKCLQPGLVSPSKSLRPFELEDFYGVFCVYFGGVVFSVLVFLLELAVPLKHFSSNVCRGGKADRGHAEPNPPSLASA